MMNNCDTAHVWVDYYDGAYGPTLRIDIQERDHLFALIEAVNAIMKNQNVEIPLDEVFSVRYTNVSSVRLGGMEGEGWMRKSVFRTVSATGLADFSWFATHDGWYQNIGFLSGLLGGSSGGHQYFGEDSSDDALIEISYKERGEKCL